MPLPQPRPAFWPSRDSRSSTPVPGTGTNFPPAEPQFCVGPRTPVCAQPRADLHQWRVRRPLVGRLIPAVRKAATNRSITNGSRARTDTPPWIPYLPGHPERNGKQNGPESTRYCGGCHDPISLFSGTKNIFATNLTSLQGYNEGISCVACHAIQKTDIRGNANYTITQPREYLMAMEPTRAAGAVARNFSFAPVRPSIIGSLNAGTRNRNTAPLATNNSSTRRSTG